MPLRLATLLTFAARPALATGFQFVEIPAAVDMPPIEAAVWYPSDAAVPDAPNSPFGQAVAMHAPVAGRDLPLVVVSHGDGGWFGGHAALAHGTFEIMRRARTSKPTVWRWQQRYLDCNMSAARHESACHGDSPSAKGYPHSGLLKLRGRGASDPF